MCLMILIISTHASEQIANYIALKRNEEANERERERERERECVYTYMVYAFLFVRVLCTFMYARVSTCM